MGKICIKNWSETEKCDILCVDFDMRECGNMKMNRKTLWRWMALTMIAALMMCSAACTQTDANEDALLSGMHYVEITVENYGVITAELNADTAPVTVTNFMKLVKDGFYDGLTFHRIISGFMIQGGDPNGNGSGGSDQKIKGEFAANGVNNPLQHTRGVLSMARSKDYDSASSQFFIMHEDAPHLDGQYAAFGMVLTGMEVVDAICENTPVLDGNGSVAKDNQPVIVSIRKIEKPEEITEAE